MAPGASVFNWAAIVLVVKSPLRDPNDMNWNELPKAGIKPLITVATNVPLSVAAPEIARRSYCVPTVVPPISMFNEPVAPCV